tara:strand:+ start:170 stop:493 length:324 start_codon:yes stop_codon:yes gene_type:complete
MKKRLIDIDENSGIKNYYVKQNDGTFGILQECDTDGHVKVNKELRKMNTSKKNEDRLLGSIPMIIIEKWNTELGKGQNCLDKEHRAFFKMKINSPEFAAFKLTKGKI